MLTKTLDEIYHRQFETETLNICLQITTEKYLNCSKIRKLFKRIFKGLFRYLWAFLTGIFRVYVYCINFISRKFLTYKIFILMKLVLKMVLFVRYRIVGL